MASNTQEALVVEVLIEPTPDAADRLKRLAQLLLGQQPLKKGTTLGVPNDGR